MARIEPITSSLRPSIYTVLGIELELAPSDLGLAVLNRIRTRFSSLRLVLTSSDLGLALSDQGLVLSDLASILF